MNPGGAGDLTITVGGDLSQLETAFEAIPGIAQEAFGKVQSAIQAIDWSDVTKGTDTVSAALTSVSDDSRTAQTDLGNLATATSDAASAAQQAVGGLDDMAKAAGAAADETSKAGASAGDAGPQFKEAGDDAEHASDGIAQMADQLLKFGEALAVTEGLKEFGQEALTTFSNVNQAVIALTSLTGSAEKAEEAINGLKTLATSDALEFPSLVSAAQKMIGARFSIEQVQQALQTAADTAKATGVGFDSVAASVTRMALQGVAGARQLQLLDINLQDLNAAMGKAGAGADAASADISKAFSALPDAATRLAVLETALSRFSGTAQKVAQDVGGQWQILKTQFDFVMEGIGAALAPVISQILSAFTGTIIPAIQAAVEWFEKLPAPVKDAVVAIGLVVAAVAPLAAAVGGFGLAISGLSAAVPAITAVGAAFAALATESIPAAIGAISNVTLAISDGLVGALTAGETLLLGFAAAGAAVASAFVFVDQIRQLADNLSNLNGVMTAGVPAWNDFKEALESLGQLISGAVTSAFNSLMGLLGPVGDAIKSIGNYLPSFASLWDDVKTAINSIHWSDLIGPIGALNGALKDLAQAIQLITGNYPDMAAAGKTALASIQSANDKLNDSLVTQAGGYKTIGDAQANYVKTADAAKTKTDDEAKAHQDAATAATAHADAEKAVGDAFAVYGPTLDQLKGNIEIIAGSHRNAAAAAAEQAAGIQVLTDKDTASSAGVEVLRGNVDGLGSSLSSATTKIIGMDGALEHWSNTLQKMVTTGAHAAAKEVSSLSDQFSKLTDTLGPAGFDSGINTLSKDLEAMDAAAVDAFDSLNGAEVKLSLQPGDTIQNRNPSSFLSEGGLGNDIPPVPGQNPYNTNTEIYDPQDAGIGISPQGKYGTPTDSSTASATATAATTVSDAMIQAIQQAMDANAQEQAASAAVGTAAYDQLKASADAAVAAAGAAIDAAQGQTAATVAQTAATTAAASSTATLASVVSSASDTITAAATGVAAATDIVNKIVAPLLGPGQGVGGDANLTQLVNTNVPVIGSQPGAGAGNGTNAPTAFATNLIVNLNAGTVVGNNGMQQLSTMVSNEMVNQLSRMGIRLNRQ